MTIYGSKHIFPFAFAVCAMTSCVSESSDPELSVSRNQKVTFDISSITRGQVTTADNIRANSFAVFGDVKYTYYDESESTERKEVFLNRSEVRYVSDESNSGWKCTDEPFWYPNGEHSFVAIHPYSGITETQTTYSNNTLSFKYTLPDKIEDIHDLLVATHRRMYQNKNNTPATSVKFKFSHILSRINITLNIEGSSDDITVTKIELDGLSKSGIFNITPAPLSPGSSQTDDYNLSWSDHSNNGILSIDVADKGQGALFSESRALFVIPQPDNNKVIMKISYKSKGEDSEQTLIAHESLGGWSVGKIYSYSITLNTATESPNINLDVSVEEWHSEPGNEVVVPRK